MMFASLWVNRGYKMFLIGFLEELNWILIIMHLRQSWLAINASPFSFLFLLQVEFISFMEVVFLFFFKLLLYMWDNNPIASKGYGFKREVVICIALNGPDIVGHCWTHQLLT